MYPLVLVIKVEKARMLQDLLPCQTSWNLPCRSCQQCKNVTSYAGNSVMNFQHVALALQAIHLKNFDLLQIQNTTPGQYSKPCQGYGNRELHCSTLKVESTEVVSAKKKKTEPTVKDSVMPSWYKILVIIFRYKENINFRSMSSQHNLPLHLPKPKYHPPLLSKK